MARVPAPLQNGIGRYFCQIKRLTINYCKLGGSSKGMRSMLLKDVPQLIEKHPQTAVYVRERRYRHPRLVAEYLNGSSCIVCLKNLPPEKIQRHIHFVMSSSGAKAEKLKKPWYTNNPSIQGNWNPFLYK